MTPTSRPPVLKHGEKKRLTVSLAYILLAYGTQVVHSVWLCATHRHPADLQSPSLNAIGRLMVADVTIIVLLAVALWLQGRRLGDLGKRFDSSDLGRTVGLVFGTYAAYWLLTLIIAIGLAMAGHRYPVTQNVGIIVGRDSPLFPLMLVFQIVNPFAEELGVRAFLIREVAYFTKKTWVAIMVSVLVQAGYHLYQGVVPAFCVMAFALPCSIYFARTGRIWPVILSHMFYDITSTWHPPHHG